MKKLLLIFTIAMITSACMAQSENKKSVALLARSYSDHIVLRYFATSPSLFNRAGKAGYLVEKAIFNPGIAVEKLQYTPLKGSPFSRWKEEQWENNMKNANASDSTELKLAGFAMAISDSSAQGSKGDPMENGLQSLKEQRDNADMKFGFALLAANRSKLGAEGLGLRVTDNEVALGKTYVYRIRINGPVDEQNDWEYLKVSCTNFNDKYLKNNETVKRVEGDKMISFSFPESDEYYAFDVERSDDNGGSYTKLTDIPAIKLKPHGYTGKTNYGFEDKGLTNYKAYRYRVWVSTPFADELLLSEFTAMPKDKTPPPAPFLKSAEHIKPKEVELTWEMIGNETGDLKGFNVRRSNDEKGEYKIISKTTLSPSSRKFTDDNFDKEGPNYYIVEAIDTAGNTARSFPAYVTLIDSTPPAIPVIASAVIDSVGKIIIRVKPNQEKDFMGYQLLKANSPEHEFSVVEETFKDSLGSTTFILSDSTTLNTLTKNIYYQLIAFDTHYNQSEPSKIIELKKRDTIPPVSPLITDFSVSDSAIVISFVNSTSEDAVRNILLRREAGTLKFDSIFSNNDIHVTRYTDKKISGGKQYEYAMIAKDDGGLVSKPSNIILLKTLLNNKLPTPVLQGAYDSRSKNISLLFIVDEKIGNRKLKVEIYKRADKGSVWMAYKTVEFVNGKPFTDAVQGNEKEMIYCIRISADEKTSNFSNELDLKF